MYFSDKVLWIRKQDTVPVLHDLLSTDIDEEIQDFELNFRKSLDYVEHLPASKEESLHCRGLENKVKLNWNTGVALQSKNNYSHICDEGLGMVTRA